jgi:hypothetical protein
LIACAVQNSALGHFAELFFNGTLAKALKCNRLEGNRHRISRISHVSLQRFVVVLHGTEPTKHSQQQR